MDIKKTSLVIVVAALLGFGLVLLNAQFKVINTAPEIAYVDVNKVIAASKDLKELKEYQQGKLAELKDFVSAALKEVEAQKNAKKKTELEAKYNAELNLRKGAMDKEYAEALVSIDNKISNIIKAKAKELGFTYAVPKAMLLAGGVDITDSVVEAVK